MGTTTPAVRILPMNRRKEFRHCKNTQELQQKFFLEDLPFRPNGYYRFYRAGLVAGPGTVILFQSDGRIIASAVLRDREHFEKRDEDGHGGCLYIDVSSIKVFDPVPKDVLSRIWPEVKRLGRVKWSVNPEGYAAFECELKHIETPKV